MLKISVFLKSKTGFISKKFLNTNVLLRILNEFLQFFTEVEDDMDFKGDLSFK